MDTNEHERYGDVTTPSRVGFCFSALRVRGIGLFFGRWNGGDKSIAHEIKGFERKITRESVEDR